MNFILDNLPEIIIVALVLCLVVLGAYWLALLALHLWEKWGVVRLAHAERCTALERQRLDNALIRPDALTGLLPVHREAIPQITDAVMTHIAQRIATMQAPQPVPHTLHYHVEGLGGTSTLPAALTGPAAQIVPSFRQLFESGIITPDRLLCGYRDNGPHFGTLKDVFSTLIVAKSGGGKTTLQRCLVAQACMMGAQVGVIDPHGHTREGLARALQPLSTYQLFEPAIEEKSIEQAMHFFMRMLSERISTPVANDFEWPIRILAVDEINMLIDDYGKDFATDLSRIAERGRKVGMFVFAAGQSAQMGRTGGDATLRKAFVGRYVLNHDKDAVRDLIQDRNMVDLVPRLQPGQTIFVPKGSEPVPLTIPNTTEADLRACFPPQVVEPVPLSVIDPVPVSVPSMTWQVAPQAAHVKQLLKSGKTFTEVISEVWGITQKGRAWQEASGELRQILCSLIPD